MTTVQLFDVDAALVRLACVLVDELDEEDFAATLALALISREGDALETVTRIFEGDASCKLVILTS